MKYPAPRTDVRRTGWVLIDRCSAEHRVLGLGDDVAGLGLQLAQRRCDQRFAVCADTVLDEEDAVRDGARQLRELLQGRGLVGAGGSGVVHVRHCSLYVIGVQEPVDGIAVAAEHPQAVVDRLLVRVFHVPDIVPLLPEVEDGVVEDGPGRALAVGLVDPQFGVQDGVLVAVYLLSLADALVLLVADEGTRQHGSGQADGFPHLDVDEEDHDQEGHDAPSDQDTHGESPCGAGEADRAVDELLVLGTSLPPDEPLHVLGVTGLVFDLVGVFDEHLDHFPFVHLGD